VQTAVSLTLPRRTAT